MIGLVKVRISLTEILCLVLKLVVHDELSQLAGFCKDEWVKITIRRCERLVSVYRRRLIEVTTAKEVLQCTN